jgi:anti-sigma B factor antagonist
MGDSATPCAETNSGMSLQIDTRQEGDVTVIACAGPIQIGETANRFRDVLRDTLRSGAKKILLDLGGVKYVDSTGIGELVGLFTNASEIGAGVRLANIPRKVRDVLEVTRLITVFEVYDTVETGLDGF